MADKQRKKPRFRTVRFYLRPSADWYKIVRFTASKTEVADIPLLTSQLPRTKPGYPWECWLAEAIKDFAELHPEAFPHELPDEVYVYVKRTTLYIVDKITDTGELSHCIQYRHSMAEVIDRFDKAARSKEKWAAFLKEEPDHVLVLKPGNKKQRGPMVSTRERGGKHSVVVSRGARRRAENAGLIPRRTGKVTDEELYS